MKGNFKRLLLLVLVFSMITTAFPVNAADYIPAARKSVVFDRNYYARYSSDVIPGFGSTEAGLYKHFYNHGIGEGRQGSPIFNVKYYLQNNSDLANGYGKTNYVQGMKHFVNSGWKESFRTQTAPYENLGESFETKVIGQDGLVLDYSGTNAILNTAAAFDATQIWKFTRNSDGSYTIVSKTTGLALSLESYTYLSGTNVCLKEVSTGREQRWYIHKYNTGTYVLRPLSAPSCVLEMQGLTSKPGINAEIYTYNGGNNQLFKISNNTSFDTVTPVIFDSNYYAEYSSDVIPGFGSTASGLYKHFYNHGIKEGRQASPIFSIKYYMQNNSDLANGYGKTNYVQGMKHFVNSGWKESFRTQTAPYMNFGDTFETRIVCANGMALDYTGSNVILDTATTFDSTQVWQFTRNSDGSYTIVNKTVGLALSLESYTYLSGTNVCLKEVNTGREQRWYIHKYSTDRYVLRPLSAPSCVLEMQGLNVVPGTNAEIYTYNGGNNQVFAFNNINEIETMIPVDLGNDFYARINNSGLGTALAVSGTNVVSNKMAANTNQIWKFEKNADGTYRIINVSTGKSLNVDGGFGVTGTNISVSAKDTSNAQKWYVFEVSGSYIFVPKCSSAASLDITDSKTAEGINVRLCSYGNTAGQKFDIAMLKIDNNIESVIWNDTPAFPAEVGDTVDLDYYNVQFSKNDKIISSKNIIWSSDEIAIVDNKIEIKTSGVYKLNAKTGSKTINVYIIAKNPSDSDYTLYYNDFNSGSFDGLSVNMSSGSATFSGGKFIMNGVGKVYLPSYLADFYNYTITSNATLLSGESASKWFSFMYRLQNENLYYHYIAKVGTTASNGIIHQKRESSSAWSYQAQTPYSEALKASKSYLFKLEAYGNTAGGYINNKKLLRTHEINALSKGKLGLQVYGTKVAFDDIKISIDFNKIYDYMTVNKYQALDKASNGLLVNGMADFSILASTKGYTLSLKSKKIAILAKTSEFNLSQGCCSDGVYIYGAIRNSDETGVIIRKHKLSDGSYVATSKVLFLGHGNDLTYDSKNNRIVCARGGTLGNELIFIDPNTLTITGSVAIDTYAGAITYNEKYDCYAISRGGKTLEILNSDFEIIKTYTRTDKTGYTAQGMGSDDNYIYFPMSYQDKKNVIVVYDWYGNYVMTIQSDVTREAESMFWVNGKYYFAHNYYLEGMNVWEGTFKIS